jgi:hypothetical protein
VVGRVTRRELIARTIVASTAAALATPVTAAAATPSAETDAGVLTDVVRIELLLAFAYERVLASGLLTTGAQPIARQLLGHEHAHLATLTAELEGLRGMVPPGPASVAAADEELATRDVPGSLAGLHTQRDCLKLLIDIEGVAEGGYYAAMRKLRDPALLRTCAAIMACEAQHWTVLSELQHPGEIARAVPSAYVQGSR